MKTYHKFFLVLGFLSFAFSSIGQLTIIHNCTNATGYHPTGSLTLSGNKLYGVAGGGANGYGCLFSIDTTSYTYTDIYDFNGDSAYAPQCPLVIAGNVIYCMSANGGKYGNGSVFSIHTDGSHFKTLVYFGNGNGVGSLFGLTLSGKTLYGSSTNGGKNGTGYIYTVDTIGNNFTDIFDIAKDTGAVVEGTFTIHNNKVYGVMSKYNSARGFIFKMNLNGTGLDTLSTLYQNNIVSPNLNNPSLLLLNGVLYGSSPYGGLYYTDGNIFSVDTAGKSSKDLFDFNYMWGTNAGNLTYYKGAFYGLTYKGGANNDGVLFSIDTNGNKYRQMLDFNVSNGSYPGTSLTLVGNNLYGVADWGGSNNQGIIFKYNPANWKMIDTLVNTNVKCYGDSTGSITANIYEGTPPYSFVWTHSGATSQKISNLKAGTYTVTATDNFGNTITDSITVKQLSPSAVKLKALTTLSACKVNSGVAQLHVSGGVKPYSFVWSPNVSNDSIATNLTVGYDTCLVTDSLGCSLTYNFAIKDSGLLNATIVTTNIKCNGDSSGSANAIALGKDTSHLTYQWYPYGGTNAIATHLIAGTYTIMVTDTNGCQADTFATVTQPLPLVANVYSYFISNSKYCTGAAFSSASGGVKPYTYYWNIDSTTYSIHNLCVGNYCCKTTDSNGCIDSACTSVIIDSTVGLPTINSTQFSVTVYPNPSTGVFTFKASSNIGDIYQVDVYNILGEKLASQSNIHTSTFSIELNNQPNGIYFYRITNNTAQVISGKLIIQH